MNFAPIRARISPTETTVDEKKCTFRSLFFPLRVVAAVV